MVEFDVAKDEENRRKRGLPLRFGALLFDGRYVEEEDVRRDYGETRLIATGPIAEFGERIHVVVYTWRNGERRIVSFRKANAREIAKYQANVAGRD